MLVWMCGHELPVCSWVWVDDFICMYIRRVVYVDEIVRSAVECTILTKHSLFVTAASQS